MLNTAFSIPDKETTSVDNAAFLVNHKTEHGVQ
jgi:hypothetical protein